MVILSNKIMQKTPQKLPPKRGKVNLPWCCGNGERVIPIYAEAIVRFIGNGKILGIEVASVSA